MKLYINLIKKNFKEHQKVLIKSLSVLENEILFAAEIISNSLKNKNLVMWCGNGGSASDSLHLSAELIGRFKLERSSYPAISLTTDSSVLTSLSNDYSYDIVFSRQCESLVSKDDIVIGISTSGNSENVIKGLKASKKNGGLTIGLLGNNGGKIKNIVDISLVVNATSVPRIQEAHRVIYHIICEIIEEELARIE